MTKQDWRKEKDYEYTLSLDNRGWLWEFTRRTEDYRREYEACRLHIEENYDGEWSKEEPFFSPARGSLETFEEWEKRRKSKKGKRILTDTQSQALRWGLFAMYDPALPYNKEIIRFDLSNPFPAFYATSPEQVNAKGLHVIGLQDFIKLLKPKRFNINEDMVFVAFDTRRPLADQICKAKDFLKNYQVEKFTLKRPGKPQSGGFPIYIRMLDAIEAEGDNLTPGKIIQIIDPKKKIQGKKERFSPSYKQWNKYGEDTLKSARKARDFGCLALLFDICNTD